MRADLVGVLAQREGSAGDQGACRLVARDEQGQQEDEQLTLVE